jgi:hypothetical protein
VHLACKKPISRQAVKQRKEDLPQQLSLCSIIGESRPKILADANFNLMR